VWPCGINNAVPIEIQFALGHFVCGGRGPEMLKPPDQNMLELCNMKILCMLKGENMLELHKSFENI